MKITVETRIDAPVAEVWQRWTTPEDIVKWNAASDDWHTTRAEVDLRAGGRFNSRMEAKDGSMGFDFEGTYREVSPHSLIVSDFGDRELRVEFIEDGGATIVRETFDAETEHDPEYQREGWQAILDNFARHVAAQRG